MAKCDTCKHKTTEDGWAVCDCCIHAPDLEDKYKPLTNADRIRAMTDEELAKIIMCPYDNDHNNCVPGSNCLDCCLNEYAAAIERWAAKCPPVVKFLAIKKWLKAMPRKEDFYG